MGGGSSVLSPELSKCLTQPSLDKFHQMQAECEAKNMTPMEMYVYLTAQYEDLVKAEREAVNALLKPSKEKDDRHAQKRKPQPSSSSSRPQAHTAPPSRQQEKPAFTRQQSLKLEEDYMSKDLLNEFEESCDLDLRPIYDPYIESVVGKVFSVVDDPHVQNVVNMLLETGNVTQARSNFVVEDSFVKQEADGSLECTVCRMKFDVRSTLDAHITHSPIHSVNMKIRREIFQTTLKEAQRLAKLAQQTINKLNGRDPNEAATTTPRDGPEAVARQRWKKAVNKVICNRLKAQFMPLIEQICETPVGVKMLHAGSKYFYKEKVSFDLHIYLHMAQDAVEIVPHFIPGRKQRTASIQAFPRIYLDYRILVPLVLGMDITNSRLSISESSTYSASNNFASGVTSRVVAMTTSSSDGDADLNKTIETALTSYTLNRLRVAVEGKASSSLGGGEIRFWFDIQGIQNSPLLPGPPAGVKPVPLSLEKIKLQYEEQVAATRRRSKTGQPPTDSSTTSQTTAEPEHHSDPDIQPPLQDGIAARAV